MNTKRIIFWIGFIVVIALIIWGMVAAAKKSSQETASLPLPTEITAADWTKGNANAPVTLVEYSDFQCPACGAYFPLVEQLFNESSSTMRLVYRHFPLPQHANAVPAAKAAEAAGKQGKFWEMYGKLFSTQKEWENSTDASKVFAGYAQGLGLDMTKYNADAVSKEIEDKINESVKGGVKAGINSTPTFYVNGQKIQNPSSYEEFKKIINDAATTKN